MKLALHQLAQHLTQSTQKGLYPCYFVAGDEPLLVEEACALLRQTAAKYGFSDRQQFTVEPAFNWSHFLAACQTGSLFSSKQLIELSFQQGKIDEDGRTALEAYLKNPDPDKILLARAPKLEAAQQKSAWYQAWDARGIHLTIYPLSAEQLPGWIKQRLHNAGIQASPEVAQLLAEQVEGNLLAAAQEIEKLQLSLENKILDVETLMAFISDHARFSVYDLADHALQGHAEKAYRILHHLYEEGIEPPIILWALTREIRILAQLQTSTQTGQAIGPAMQRLGIWDKRKPWVQMALKRQTQWQVLLQKAAEIDRVIKGAAVGNVEDELETLTLAIAGISGITVQKTGERSDQK